jgi:TolA-binding protein
MITLLLRAAFVWVVAFAASGCFLWTSRDEGDAIVKRIDALEVERAKERELLEAKMAELQKLIEEASAVLRRNSADQGLQIEELQQKMRVLEGQLAELRQAGDETRKQAAAVQGEIAEQRGQSDERARTFDAKIAALARQAGVDVPINPEEVPAKAAEHFDAGKRAVLAGDHSYGRALLRAYLERYPKDAKADDAQLWLGQSYLTQGQPAAALGELRRVLSTYPKSDVLEDVLWSMGRAFWRLRSCADAKASFQALAAKFPKTTLGKKAAEHVKALTEAGDDCDPSAMR